MKSAEEILENHRRLDYSLEGELAYNTAIRAMKEYAKQAIDAQLEIAANEAIVESETPIGRWHPEYSVDKDSIIDCTRIELP